MEEAGELAKNTSILMNVSEFDNISTATDTLVSALRAYKKEGSDVATLSMDIINKYNEIGNSYAISTSDLAESLTRSSATLVAANNDLSQSIALTTAANSVIQDPNAVGNALKVVAMRLRGTNAKVLEEMGEETDGLVESTSKLQEKVQALTAVGGKEGINILADDGSYKSTYQILLEISEVFEEISDVNAAALLELLAGKQRGSVVAAILQNGDMLQNVYESAETSDSSAMHELETYMDSIQGRMDVFNNTLQTFWMNLLDSEVIKAAVDFATKIFKFLDTAPGKVLALGAAFKTIASTKGFSLHGLYNSLHTEGAHLGASQLMLSQLGLTGATFDESNVNAYAAAISNLTAKQQANMLAARGLTQEQIKQVLATNQVSEAAMQEALMQGRASKAKTQAITMEALAADAKKSAIVITINSIAATKTEAEQKQLGAVVDRIKATSADQLTKEKLEELLVQQQLNEELKEEVLVTSQNAAAVAGKVASNKVGFGAMLSGLWAANPAMAIISGITALVSIVTLATTAYDHFTDSSEELISKADEAKNSISELKNEFKDNSQTVKDTAERFAELAQGVDLVSGKNVSLTTDDYAEFLDLSNQLADVFPTLSRNYDENGNAIVQLSGDTNTMVQSLEDLLEVERKITQQNIADQLPDVYKGSKAQSDQLKAELRELEQDREFAQRQVELFQGLHENADSWLSSGVVKIDKGDKTDAAFRSLINDYKTMWSGAGLDFQQLTGEGYDAVDSESYVFTNLSELSEDELAAAKAHLTTDMDDFANHYAHEVRNLDSKIATVTNENKANWNGVLSSISAWLSTDSAYQTLNDDMQSVVQTMINNIDFSSLNIKSWEDMQTYIQDNIIDSIQEADYAQDAFADLFKISSEDKSLSEYVAEVKAKVQEIADIKPDDTFTFDSILDSTGFGDKIEQLETNAKALQNLLKDTYSGSDASLANKINEMTPNDIAQALSLMKEYGLRTLDEIEYAIANKTFEVAVDYNVESEGLEKLQTALDETVSATGLSAESIGAIKDRYQDLEDYDAASLFEETTHGIHLNAQAVQELEDAYEEQNKQALDNKLDGLKKQYDNLTDQINTTSDAFKRADLYSQRQNIIDQINDTATLAARYEGLTSSFNQWQKAQSGATERDMYESIISGREEVNEEIKRGWFDQGTIEYLELMSGKDLSASSFNEILNVYKQLNKEINSAGYNIYDFFTIDKDGNSTSDGVFNFFDTVRAAFGETVAWIDDNGGYHFDFTKAFFGDEEGDAAVAKALGISEELVQIILRAARDARFEINLESSYSNLADLKDQVEVVNDRLKEIGATDYTFNINSTSIDDLDKQIEQATLALDFFKDDSGKLIVDVDNADYQAAQQLLATLMYQKQTLDEAIILKIDTTNATTGAELVVKKLQEFKAAANELEVKTKIGADTTDAKRAVYDAKAALEQEAATAGIDLKAKLGVDLTEQDAQIINQQISNIKPEMLVDVGIDDEKVQTYQSEVKMAEGEVVWENNLKAVTDWISDPNDSKTATGKLVWYNDTTHLIPPVSGGVNLNGTAHLWGSAYAGGKWGAPRTETALVGELGPEMRVRGNRWELLGQHGTEFADIQKGDVIFNHRQTEQLLKNGHIFGRGNAYMQGTSGAAYLNAIDSGFGGSTQEAKNYYNARLKKYKQEMYYSKVLEGKREEYEKSLQELDKGVQKAKEALNASYGSGPSRAQVDEAANEANNVLKKYTSGSSSKDDSKQTLDYIEMKIEEIEAVISKTSAELVNYADDANGILSSNKDSIAAELKQFEKGGNVNLLLRPQIDTSELEKAGWGEQGEGIATVFTSTYSNAKEDLAINFTPIIADEYGNYIRTMSPDELQNYAEDVIDGVRTDDLNIQIGSVFNGNNAIQEAEKAAEKIHELHEQYFTQTGISQKNIAYDKLVQQEKEKVEVYSQAEKYYAQKANELLNKVDAKYRDKAQYGAIAIEDFVGEKQGKLAEAIQAYRDMAAKADDAATKLEEAIAQRAQLRLEQFNDNADDYDNRGSLIESENSLIEAQIDLVEESGERLSANYYVALRNNTEAIKSNLELKRSQMQADRDAAVAAGDIKKGTDEWFEMQNAIDEVSAEIIQCQVDIEGFQNSINDLKWDNLEKLIDRFDALDSELSHLFDRFTDNDDVVDEFGNWTDKGIAAMGVAAQQMEVAQYKAQEYGKAIEDLKKDYNKGLYSQDEYDEKLAELTENQWESIEAYESAKDALVDLNKTRIDAVKDSMQKEIDAYKELIDKQKESLDAEKDLHDFERDVADQTKEIAKLERKIAALRGDSSASAAAQRKQLEAELLEAKANLEETFYDRSIQNQQTALDKEYENYEETMNDEMEALDKWLKDEEAVIAESLNTVKANTDVVLNEMHAISEQYGIKISDSIVTPWENGSNAISGYKDSFVDLSDTFSKELDKIIAKQQELQLAAEAAAKSAVATVQKDSTRENPSTNPPKQPTNNNPAKTEEPKKEEPKKTEVTKGQTVTVDKDATNFSDKSGNKHMASFVPGGSYTVMQTSGNQVLIGKGGTATGWVNKEDLQGYAKGTTGVKNSQWAWIDEMGEELVLHAGSDGKLAYLTKGSAVVPHDLTNKLMDLVADPTQTLENSRPIISAPHITNNEINVNMEFGSVVNIEHVDNDTVPNLTKAVEKQMDKYLKSLNANIRKYVR